MSYPRLQRFQLMLDAFGGSQGSRSSLIRTLAAADRDLARRALAIQVRRIVDLEIGQWQYPLPDDWYKTFAVMVNVFRAYLRWQDQDGNIWYTWATSWREFQHHTSPPAGINIAASLAFIPSWFLWTAPNAITYKVYPSLWGEIQIVDASTSLNGVGSSERLELRDEFGQPWYPSLATTTAAPELQLRRVSSGGTLLRAEPLTPTAMVLVEPEALRLVDPNLPPGRPRYVTTFQGHLQVYPVPDAKYQLDHKCFVAPMAGILEANGLPEPFLHTALLKAVALVLQPHGRLAAARQLNTMYEVLANHLGTLYAPIMRDSKAAVHLAR